MSVKVLGSGTFGVVRKEGNSAVKQFKRKYTKKENGELVLQYTKEFIWEAQCLTNIRSQYIVKAQNVRVETQEIELELMDGTLHDLVKKKKTSLRLILQAFWQIAMAIRDINLAGYIHRDVKPQNILYKEVDGKYVFKLCDFSSATTISNVNLPDYTTYPFAAPEAMFGSNYNEKVDVWSLAMSVLWCFSKKLAGDTLEGCFKYFMKTFGIPKALEADARNCFEDDDITEELGKPSVERSLKYVASCLKAYGIKKNPKGLVQLLVKMVSVDPATRIGVEDILKCQVFDEFLDYDLDMISPSPARSPPSSEWRPFYDWNGALNLEHRYMFIEMLKELTKNTKILIHTFDIFDRIAGHFNDAAEAQEHLMACYDLVTRFMWSSCISCKSIAKQYCTEVQAEVQSHQPWILKKVKYLCYRNTYYELNDGAALNGLAGIALDQRGLNNILMDLNKLYLRNRRVSEW
ncbi:ser/thr protein kinase [Kaumoebavirus]|uniref:ser/thr protein kinase n=1 Tax=Kaumoebavirus TaxID=1859492 RepID=UPI0009C2BAE0|nr:ser/thr protein kinase [Kaumoebavirus]ARA72245.1 ser/thr protein kinase [Kaumoebavirus]